MRPQLSVSGLAKTYETNGIRIPVLSEVNLEVGENEFATIIGPNASGKSTLLKIIAGIIAPDAGTVVADRISYMPQEHALLPWRTVEENLFLPSDVAGISRTSARDRVEELLAEAGLERYRTSYPSALSGGTRQRIALLRTLLQKRSVLLLDEPFAPLDALTRLSTQDWLLELLGDTHPGVLLVTHDIGEAMYLSDVIYVLGGRPGCIKEKISVPLPRPRTREQARSPEGLLLEKKLLDLLVPRI